MLRIHHDPERLQLRRGTTFGMVLGVVALLLGICVFFIALGRAMAGDQWGLAVPALVAMFLCFWGVRAIFGGALLLDAHAGGTRIAALSRDLAPNELRSVEVRWRTDVSGSKEVEIVLLLPHSAATLAPVWLSHHDPHALAKTLGTALGVRTEVTSAAEPNHHVPL